MGRRRRALTAPAGLINVTTGAVAIIDWGHRDRPAITAVTPLDGLIVEQMPYTGV
jgi:hypothetical protein